MAATPSSTGIRMSISTTSGRYSHRCPDAGRPVGGLTDHLDVIGPLQQRPDARAHQVLVVDDQDADHGAGIGNGNTAST